MVPFLHQLWHAVNGIIAIDPRSGLFRHAAGPPSGRPNPQSLGYEMAKRRQRPVKRTDQMMRPSKTSPFIGPAIFWKRYLGRGLSEGLIMVDMGWWLGHFGIQNTGLEFWWPDQLDLSLRIKPRSGNVHNSRLPWLMTAAPTWRHRSVFLSPDMCFQDLQDPSIFRGKKCLGYQSIDHEVCDNLPIC